jgi:hypothetical protein
MSSGFQNYRELAQSITGGKTWISTFRKVPSAAATVTGQWFDYGYAGGNPIPNYYAASPLEAALLEPDKGIIVPRMSGTAKQFLHRLTVMSAGATSSLQPMYLLDYLLYYPFVDMDAAGEDQAMAQSAALTRYTDGVGVQMMVVSQSPTVGGGRFTITYTDSDNVERTTTSMFCGAAQPAGTVVSAVLATGGLTPFVPLEAGVKGVKNVVSCNFSVANGGLCAIVLVRPLEVTQTLESCAVAGLGAAVEKEAVRLRGGIVEIKDGAFLGIIGQGVAGSLASSPLVGVIETVWN